MKMRYTALILLLLMTACSCNENSSSSENAEPNMRNTTPFPVGAAVQAGRLSNGEVVRLFRDDFSSLTAEWEMKMSPMYNNPNGIDFNTTDQLVSFAEEKDARVHGHALIWHSATPDWIENFSGSDAEFETLIENYIKDVVGRYGTRIESWDVVNEAFADGSGDLRDTVFRQKLGDDYVAKCFQWAREADPDVKLFYNDYGTIYDAPKMAAMLAMLDDFETRGIPIDGVGFQVHISYNFPSREQIVASVGNIVQRDLLIHFSELDIRVNPEAVETTLTPELLQLQKTKADEIVDIYSSIPEELQFGITTWGVRDSETWLRSFWDNEYEWPLLFDDEYQPKPAYFSFIEPFSN